MAALNSLQLLHCSVQKLDTVDLEIKVRSGTVFGFMEVSVRDDFSISLVSGICVNISLIGIQSLAVYLESRCVMTSSIFSTVPLAAAFSLTSVRTTEPVEIVPVQSVSIASPLAAAVIA